MILVHSSWFAIKESKCRGLFRSALMKRCHLKWELIHHTTFKWKVIGKSPSFCNASSGLWNDQKKKIPLPCSIKSPLISLEFKTHPKGWGYTGRRSSSTPQPGFLGPSGMMLVSSCWWWQGDKMGFSKSLKPFLPMSPSCVLRPYLAIGKNLCYRFFHFWLRKFLQVLVSFLT